MNDNVIKFRRPEKRPEPPKKNGHNKNSGEKARAALPGWVYFAALLALALAIYAFQRVGLGG